MHQFQESDELRVLLDALCEETITAEQMRRLEELVLGHPEAEAYYVQYMNLYADLARNFGGMSRALPRDCIAEGLPHRDDETGKQEKRYAGKQVSSLPLARPARLSRRGRFVLWGSVALTALAASVLVAVAWLRRPQEAAR